MHWNRETRQIHVHLYTTDLPVLIVVVVVKFFNRNFVNRKVDNVRWCLLRCSRYVAWNKPDLINRLFTNLHLVLWDRGPVYSSHWFQSVFFWQAIAVSPDGLPQCVRACILHCHWACCRSYPPTTAIASQVVFNWYPVDSGHLHTCAHSRSVIHWVQVSNIFQDVHVLPLLRSQGDRPAVVKQPKASPASLLELGAPALRSTDAGILWRRHFYMSLTVPPTGRLANTCSASTSRWR